MTNDVADLTQASKLHCSSISHGLEQQVVRQTVHNILTCRCVYTMRLTNISDIIDRQKHSYRNISFKLDISYKLQSIMSGILLKHNVESL